MIEDLTGTRSVLLRSILHLSYIPFNTCLVTLVGSTTSRGNFDARQHHGLTGMKIFLGQRKPERLGFHFLFYFSIWNWSGRIFPYAFQAQNADAHLLTYYAGSWAGE